MLTFLLAAALSAPNVVLLSVDTLRADHLGCYGYPHDTSPNLDKLAKQSLLFEDAVCEVPLTGPSMGSMLASQFPRQTGMTRNGLRMPDDVPLVAEQFQHAGYYTFCVQSNWTVKAKISGLDRGFDAYDDGFEKRRWGIIKSERDGDEVTNIARKMLKQRDTSKPFFAWIHYSDPHAPYKMRRKFRVTTEKDFDHKDKARVAPEYDAEIKFTDHQIARLREALPRENTVIVFVGDHGESLYEHDYLGHGRRIYQTGLRIPLFIHGPGIEPKRVNTPARGIDVGPTLLALAGLDAPPSMVGRNLLVKPAPDERVRVVETYGGAVPNIPGAELLMADQPPQMQGVLVDGWKLILTGDRPELYHLEQDPMELNNLSARHPERVSRLGQLIKDWHEGISQGESQPVDLSEDDRNALESLGYLE